MSNDPLHGIGFVKTQAFTKTGIVVRFAVIVQRKTELM